MILSYSRTGTTDRAFHALHPTPIADYPGEGGFVLVVPTYGQPRTGGFIPAPVIDFLKQHGHNLKAVVGIGNRVFGRDFCRAAQLISEKFGVPVLAQVDLVPTDHDLAVIHRFEKGIQ